MVPGGGSVAEQRDVYPDLEKWVTLSYHMMSVGFFHEVNDMHGVCA